MPGGRGGGAAAYIWRCKPGLALLTLGLAFLSLAFLACLAFLVVGILPLLRLMTQDNVVTDMLWGGGEGDQVYLTLLVLLVVRWLHTCCIVIAQRARGSGMEQGQKSAATGATTAERLWLRGRAGR